MLKLRAAVIPPSLLIYAIAMPAYAASYSVNGFVLGGQVSSASAQYREYRCVSSEQFDGFTWCQKSRQPEARRGPVRATSSILHSQDGKIAYINRQQDLVSFGARKVDEQIHSHARNLGSQPRIAKMPRRPGGPEGVLALWGQVAIEPLDGESIKILADGESPKKGFLVDFIGNLFRSAQDGLPIYRITGGAGLIWVASYDQRGRGALRITAVDASALSSAATATPPLSKPTVEPSSQLAGLQSTPTGVAEDRVDVDGSQGAERNQAATQVPAAEDTVPAAVDAAGVELEIAKSVNERAATRAEKARLGFALTVAYSLIGGLFLLLVALCINLLVLNRRKRPKNRTLTGVDIGNGPVVVPERGNAACVLELGAMGTGRHSR